MPQFTIKGKHELLSKEELRALLQASATVLEFHGGKFKPRVWVYLRKPGTMGKISAEDPSQDAAGLAYRSESRIDVINTYNTDDEMTVILHELIHLSIDPDTELATSTLTAKLKPTVCKVFNVLMDGVYQRAAYVAHTKIAYRPKGSDKYNPKQYDPAHPSRKGEIYRRA